MTDYSAVLEVYDFTEILELNEYSEEDILKFLVEHGYIDLPEILPLEFDD